MRDEKKVTGDKKPLNTTSRKIQEGGNESDNCCCNYI